MKQREEYIDIDSTASSRKEDHITLAFKSQQDKMKIDGRFYYEPMLSSHKEDVSLLKTTFGGKELELPLWVSSMTGGTQKAKMINFHLAKACGAYGFGMGLGSCRSLLYSDEYFADFDVKKFIGDYPLFANLGVAQIEILADQGDLSRIENMLNKLQADGLIIHVNPLQEWFQPEGDRFKYAPLDTIKRVLDTLKCPIIVKEVGQGIGPKSLDSLMRLPLYAVEFAASGGTNFSTIEHFRAGSQRTELLKNATQVGHSADEMVHMLNDLQEAHGHEYLVKDIIISGGVRDFLDSYYLRNLSNHNAISGHASGFLKYALEGEESLSRYIETFREGLLMAESFLTVKPSKK